MSRIPRALAPRVIPAWPVLDVQASAWLTLVGNDMAVRRDLEAIKEFRERNGISDDLHKAVLARLDLTDMKLDTVVEENHHCVVCMEREINCIFISCGHMCACMDCGGYVSAG